MIVLNLGLENRPGWHLVPASIQEAYLKTPPFGGKKIILNEDDFLLSPEERYNVRVLSSNIKYHEWQRLRKLLKTEGNKD